MRIGGNSLSPKWRLSHALAANTAPVPPLEWIPDPIPLWTSRISAVDPKPAHIRSLSIAECGEPVNH